MLDNDSQNGKISHAVLRNTLQQLHDMNPSRKGLLYDQTTPNVSMDFRQLARDL